MEENKIIGIRIKEALTHKGLKQKDLAKFLNVPVNTISYFCSGSRIPNTKQIIKIARFLDISADYLFGFSDVPKSNIDLRKASELTNIPEKTLLKLSELFKLKNKFDDNIGFGFHKNSGFFFFFSDTADGFIQNIRLKGTDI